MRLFQLIKKSFSSRRSRLGPIWRLEEPRVEIQGKLHRVTIDFAGKPVWFETSDAPLRASPEAGACIALLPALSRGARVETAAAMDPEFLEHIRHLPPLWASWWGFSTDLPFVPAPAHAEFVPQPADGIGVCFTGGVDSFHTLLRGAYRFDRLVFVHGFDIPLTDRQRVEAFLPSLQRAAEAKSALPIVVRTNLREHPVFAEVNWERTHGAALAAIGHLLTPILGRLVVASTFSYPYSHPWGSHWQTDPLWSGRALRVIHDAAEWARSQKISQIAGEPLLWDSLRVCWENRTATGNCSRCEKCLRTMVLLAEFGQLRHYQVFDTATPLGDLLDALPSIPARLCSLWHALASRHPEQSVRSAIIRLTTRSKASGPRLPIESCWPDALTVGEPLR